MKVLILDGQGKTGHVVTKIFKQNFIDSDSISMDELFVSINLNSHKPFSFIETIIMQTQYDIILNLARIINVEAEENKITAIMINAYLPHFLENLTSKTTAKVFQISTDCVFSGINGPYLENSIKDGTSFYSLTKNIGELDNDKDLTIRTSIIGPDCDQSGNRLFNWFMMNQKDIYGYTNVYWNGITSIEFAKLLIKLIKLNITGIIHLGSDSISKYELLTLFNKYFKDGKTVIIKNDLQYSNKVLLSNRHDNRIIVSDYKNMMLEMKNWILANKKIYKHYFSEGGD